MMELNNPTGYKLRPTDAMGGGHFGAGRDWNPDTVKYDREHMGLDWVIQPGGYVLPALPGHVHRRGTVYGNAEIGTDYNNYLAVRSNIQLDKEGPQVVVEARYLYLSENFEWPESGQHARIGYVIGRAGDIRQRYGHTITVHIHFDLKRLDTNVWVDPTPFFFGEAV